MDYKTLEPFTFWGKLAFLLDVINISKASVWFSISYDITIDTD